MPGNLLREASDLAKSDGSGSQLHLKLIFTPGRDGCLTSVQRLKHSPEKAAGWRREGAAEGKVTSLLLHQLPSPDGYHQNAEQLWEREEVEFRAELGASDECYISASSSIMVRIDGSLQAHSPLPHLQSRAGKSMACVW